MKTNNNQNGKNSFTEEELLILCNYVYYDESVKYATIDEMLDERNSGEVFGNGGMSSEDAGKLFDRMADKAASSDFGSIRRSRVLDEYGVRAVCFEKADGSAAVVFRGTGGTYEAWYDNVVANYKSDTRIQKIAGDFVKYDCGGYQDLTVTGHSKGGNLAQYTTVVCLDKVSRCLSFDGQGQSDEFVEKYRQKTEAAGPKITSICADNDYVNVLLTSIAGTTLYVKNKYYGPVGAHSSFSLLDSSIFDEEGNFSKDAMTRRSVVVTAFANVIQMLTASMNNLSRNGEEIVTNLIASLVAGSPLAGDRDINDIDEALETKKAVKALYEYAFSELGIAGIAGNTEAFGSENTVITIPYTEYDYNKMSEVISDYHIDINEIEITIGAIEEVRKYLHLQIVAHLPLDYRLEGMCEQLKMIEANASKLLKTLEEINSRYIMAETDSLNLIGNVQA